MIASVKFSLPWPPTVNTYWRHVTIPIGKGSKKHRAMVILSDRAKDYRLHVASAVRTQRVPCGRLTGLLSISLVCFPPDHRERDLDNLLKGLLDSIAHAGVMRNDADIDRLYMERGHLVPAGRVDVLIEELPGKATVSGELFETRVS